MGKHYQQIDQALSGNNPVFAVRRDDPHACAAIRGYYKAMASDPNVSREVTDRLISLHFAVGNWQHLYETELKYSD